LLVLFGLAIFKIKPQAHFWQYPLSPHSYNHHHAIISVLDDLQNNPDFLKGDLVVEAIKAYFIPYKYIQIFFVNTMGMDLPLFINIFTILAIVINFVAIATIVYILTGQRIAIILSLILVVACRNSIVLSDASVNFPRYISQGICLTSLALFFKKRYLWALIVCSFSFIFHYGMPFYLGFNLFFLLFVSH